MILPVMLSLALHDSQWTPRRDLCEEVAVEMVEQVKVGMRSEESGILLVKRCEKLELLSK